MSTHTVTINGIDLVYDKEGSGPPVVFLHGMNAASVYWEAVVPHLLGEYTCYVLDQRGMGRSGWSAGGYSGDSYIADCTAFLEQVTGPAIVVGQSLGGVVGFGAAASRPDLVRALYSEDAVPHAYVNDPLANTAPILGFFRDMRDLAVRRDAEAWSLARFTSEIGRLTTFGPPIADVWPPSTLAFFARNAFGCDPRCYDTETDWEAEFADGICRAIRCPVHIAGGNEARGAIVSEAGLQRMREQGLEFTVTHFANAGHMVSHGQPREFITDLKAFLAKIPMEVTA